MSADYRLLRQAKPVELRENIQDAYRWVVDELPTVLGVYGSNKRTKQVIVADASAGKLFPWPFLCAT